jgi:hypothetical protein
VNEKEFRQRIAELLERKRREEVEAERKPPASEQHRVKVRKSKAK